jgi:hypothetical protein
VTPQSCCSYASFETNVALESYAELIAAVLATFAPGRFTLNFFADSAVVEALPSQPTAAKAYTAARSGTKYVLRDHAHVDFPGDYSAYLGNYEKPGARAPAPAGPTTA